DEELKMAITRAREKKGRKLYGAKKMWRELNRDGIEVARCTVERLMREMGLEGLRARKKRPRTTVPGPAGQERPSDLLERDFTAPAPDQGSWLARLHTDQANLRRAAAHAASRPEGTALVLRLGVALDRYWRARSREQEAFGLLVPVLQRPD